MSDIQQQIEAATQKFFDEKKPTVVGLNQRVPLVVFYNDDFAEKVDGIALETMTQQAKDAGYSVFPDSVTKSHVFQRKEVWLDEKEEEHVEFYECEETDKDLDHVLMRWEVQAILA